uniref:RNA polymerase beta'' subunit n=1 Tax=Timspurckia oligopyrenoides TaxID=708627 RepID=UPI001FCDDBB9|nr:RNA polymerase beta'' subunit [Timspurckia oligopyrenoides]UNJ17476.1 RNA polymerase beta'' subunit [Timspurckia oligopyrenoides]
MQKKSDKKLYFLNKVLDKQQLKKLISWVFRNYGVARAANMADQLKSLGFQFATQAGISLSLEDLRIPPNKSSLLESTRSIIRKTDQRYYRGEITVVERFQKVIDTWNNASEALKEEVIEYFKQTDPLNPIYMMAFSGARGNLSQVRQLVGMRGLMSDPQGQIIDLPIASNFREGLTVTEYFISSYGARKGLVDTALRTADSGYLTRRLVDVAQDVIIREIDCQTERGILIEEMFDNNKVLISLDQALIGRVLAEDLFIPNSNTIFARTKQEIDSSLADTIKELGVKKVLVRSPLTCEANASICQYCYGWNLAHGKIVDLGEAVGIIAAQSIGEPGTQLTMRTFHTGGVFTGELANQILAPLSGHLEYDQTEGLSTIRTTHGEEALLVNKTISVNIVGINKEKVQFFLNKNDVLFFSDNKIVEKNTVIAESPASKRLSTEKAQKYLMSDIAGQVKFDDLHVREKDTRARIINKNDLIWIVSGTVYDIPENAELVVKKSAEVKKGETIARIKLMNKFAGHVKINQMQNDQGNYLQQISIITEASRYKDTVVDEEQVRNKSVKVLSTINNYKFQLNISTQDKNVISSTQKIGKLVSDTYKTHTGGIIVGLNNDIKKQRMVTTKTSYEILGPGYIIWISEETHSIQKETSFLMIKNGEFIEEGTEICKNVFCKNSGTAEIISKDGMAKEIIIKSGIIYPCYHDTQKPEKVRGFLRPGEKLDNKITTDKLVYWEYVDYEKGPYYLIRSVSVYSITEKTFAIKKEFISETEKSIALDISLSTPFKDGERIKSIHGVNLVEIDLIAKVNQAHVNLSNEIRFPMNEKNQKQYIELMTAEELVFKEVVSNEGNSGNDTRSQILVQDGQYVDTGTIIAQTEIQSKSQGIIDMIPPEFDNNRRIMVLTEKDKKTIHTSCVNNTLAVGDWVKAGDAIAQGVESIDSGEIIGIDADTVTLRIARPYLVSAGSILYVNNGDLVRRGETIAMLIFERKKTGDIVQGLPRIEEILEARKKSDNLLNPHELLDELFIFYSLEGLSLNDAARLSLQDIQQVLVNEIQVVYQSQNVDISDKHIEVIVRQMTNKVKIENGGESSYLPGELVDLYKIENINRGLSLRGGMLATYYPVLMGITKASLNTDSFISAASFQETTKVLTEAAIAGKLDWLKGLKENVIIGRLIPAGTGFQIDDHSDLR